MRGCGGSPILCSGAELAELIAAGQLEVPLAATFPLDRVQDAYRLLEQGHTLQDRPAAVKAGPGVPGHGGRRRVVSRV